MKKILVIGDAMIDSYHFGDVNRISPEAPVPVFWKRGNVNIHQEERQMLL